MHCEPASTLIKTLGGLTALAAVAETTPTTVQRWRLPREKGGTGGYIPRKYHGKIIAHAATLGVELTPLSFFESEAA